MTITILPIDADTTTLLPSYPALNERQAFAAMDGNPVASVFGGRSGFRVGTLPSIVSVTSTTWTLNPCSARIFPAGVTYQGGYGWSSDQAITGTSPTNFTAADPSNPRVDILYIQVNDSSAGDGSGARNAPVNYLAGVASGTPVAPALPPRSFLVATISVPTAGAGSPTITLNTARYVAAGAKLPVFSAAERALMTPYVGMEIQRLDLTQIAASGVKEVWNGSTWDHFGHSEWTFNQTNPGFTSGIQFGPGALTNDASKTTDAAFVTTAGETLVVRDAGVYAVTLNGTWSHPSTARCFSHIAESTGGSVFRASGGVNEDTVGVSAPNVRLAAGGVLTPATFVIFATGSNTWTGRIRVTRIA